WLQRDDVRLAARVLRRVGDERHARYRHRTPSDRAESVLDLCLRASRAGCDDRAGARSAERCLPANHPRSRSAAAAQHARFRDETVPRATSGDHTGQPRTERHGGRRAPGVVHVVRDHRPRAPHRVRQHRQPVDGARDEPRAGDGRSAIARRDARPTAEAIAHRNDDPRLSRRGGESLLCFVDVERGRLASTADHVRGVDARHELGGGRLRGGTLAGDRARLRLVPRAAQHAARSRDRAAQPLWEARRTAAAPAVARNTSGKLAGGRTARRFRTVLATGQIALAMALLMSAGLFVKSLWKVKRVDLGIRVENFVTFSVTPGQSGYDSVRTRALFTRIEEELRALPGASAVTST